MRGTVEKKAQNGNTAALLEGMTCARINSEMSSTGATPTRDHVILTNSDGTLTALAGEALIYLRSEASRMGITEAAA
jgi:hypothetical protein